MTELPRYNILLVEDQEANVLVATSMFEMLGYSYIVANNGREAIEKYETYQFDVVLMDINMPGESGVEITKQIKLFQKEKGSFSTPIIAMTAYFAVGDMNQWEDAGIEDVIPKPFSPDYFSKTLAKYCKNKLGKLAS